MVDWREACLTSGFGALDPVVLAKQLYHGGRVFPTLA